MEITLKLEINEAAIDALVKAFSRSQPLAAPFQPTPPPIVPESPHQASADLAPAGLTLEQIRSLATPMSRKGYKDAIKAEITRLGAAKLDEIETNKYDEFASFLKNLDEEYFNEINKTSFK